MADGIPNGSHAWKQRAGDRQKDSGVRDRKREEGFGNKEQLNENQAHIKAKKDDSQKFKREERFARIKALIREQ